MADKEKLNNNKDIKLSLSETEEIIGRLKEVLNVKSDGQLAKYLGITRQNIGAARKRDDVPPGWIYKVAELSGCSMDWLRFGHGPKVRAEYTSAGSKPKGELSSQASPYKLQVSSDVYAGGEYFLSCWVLFTCSRYCSLRWDGLAGMKGSRRGSTQP